MSIKNEKFKDSAKTLALKDCLAQQLKNIVDIQETFQECGIFFWLCCSSLLHVSRNGEFNQRDCVIDIGIRIDDWKDAAQTRLVELGFQCKKFGSKECGLHYCLERKDIRINIFFFYKNETHLWRNGYMYTYRYPQVSDFIVKIIHGIRLHIPVNYDEILTAQYGEWKTENLNWDPFQSPKNVVDYLEFWKHYYQTPHPDEPSDFAKSLKYANLSIIDIGCGNGRVYILSKVSFRLCWWFF